MICIKRGKERGKTHLTDEANGDVEEGVAAQVAAGLHHGTELLNLMHRPRPAEAGQPPTTTTTVNQRERRRAGVREREGGRIRADAQKKTKQEDRARLDGRVACLTSKGMAS